MIALDEVEAAGSDLGKQDRARKIGCRDGRLIQTRVAIVGYARDPMNVMRRVMLNSKMPLQNTSSPPSSGQGSNAAASFNLVGTESVEPVP
jgi:hypothetical protein